MNTGKLQKLLSLLILVLPAACTSDIKVKPSHTWVLMEPALAFSDSTGNKLFSKGYMVLPAAADTALAFHLMNYSSGEPCNPDTFYSFRYTEAEKNMLRQLDVFAQNTPSNIHLDPMPPKNTLYCGSHYLLLQLQDNQVIKYYSFLDHTHNNVLDTLLETYRNVQRTEGLKPHGNGYLFTETLINTYRNKAELKHFFFPPQAKNRWKINKPNPAE